MEAYRIDRFGSVDGIVLRSSEDPRPGPKEILPVARPPSAAGISSALKQVERVIWIGFARS
jgi:hypothetical protein